MTSTREKFDIDLRFGQEGERWLTILADERKMEVKRDNRWHETGNIYIEYLYKGRPSGVSVTEADYFAVILTKDGKQVSVFIWQTLSLRKSLKALAQKGDIKITSGGDGGLTKGFIIPLSKIGMLTMEPICVA